MYKVQQEFQRPDPKLVERFRPLSTPIVTDAMGRYGAMLAYMKPVYPGIRLCGPALTVNTYTADNLMIHLAIKLAKRGDVIVVNTGGCEEGGLWGELMTLSAKVQGIAGLVIDGGVRDLRSLQEMEFPVFARAVTPRGTFKVSPGSINGPISCGGISVHPGDIILGDDDGIAVIPLQQAAEIYQAAQNALQKEAEIRRRIKAGELIYDILKLEKYLDGIIKY